MAEILDYLKEKSNNLLDRSKKTINEYYFKPNIDVGIGSVKLDVIGEQTLSLSSDSTDNYVESNIAYQDQISLKPIVYTVKGEVGELVYYKKEEIDLITGVVNKKLSFISSFSPSVSKQAGQVIHPLMQASAAIYRMDDVLNKLNRLTENKQQSAYLALIALRNNRVPISITTPWTDLPSFRISDIQLTQPSETKDKTLIFITLKEFRTTDLSMVPFRAKEYQNRLEDQKAPVVEQGQTQGVPTSWLHNTFGSKRR